MKRLFLFAALFAFACSLVIEPGEERCSADEGCPADMICFEGSCQVGMGCVEGALEACNRVDDDCDGIIDEDLGETPEACNARDDDCDGETDEGFGSVLEVCNGVDDDCDGVADEDVPVMLDVCNGVDDDCDGETDEGSDEVCNNRDDDCDTRVDEETAGALCGGGTICRGECVAPTCANDVTLACEGEFECNANLQPPRCEIPGPRSCENDAQCETGELCFEAGGSCFEATTLGQTCTTDVTCVDGTFCAELAAVGMSGKTCTNTCCSDSDCPGGAVCANGLLGARLCVPAAQAGTGLTGSCDAHIDCASGYCRIFAEECQPVCSTDENCQSNEACIFDVAVPGRELTTGCLTAGSRGVTGSSCDRDGDCRSLLCNGRRCIAPCSAAGQCEAGQGCTSVSNGFGQFVNVCLTENPDGRAGTACSFNDECDSLRCFEGFCVAPCCSSGQCVSGRACQPIHVGDQWPTFCIPG